MRLITTERLALLVLGLYGKRDFPAVLACAEKRAVAIKRLRGSAQIPIAGTDHFFNGHEDAMLRMGARVPRSGGCAVAAALHDSQAARSTGT